MIDLPTELRVLIYSRTAFSTEEQASVLVEYLLANPRFAPDRFGTYEPLKKFSPDKAQQAIDLIVNEAAQRIRPNAVISMVFFGRKRPPICSYRVHWSKLPHRAFEICSYTIRQQDIRDSFVLLEWLDFILGFLDIHNAWYVLFALDNETHKKNFLTWNRQHSKARDPSKGVEGGRGVGLELMEGLPGVYWGNYFGPFYVEWFGREKFKAIPCIEKRWLDTGGIFFTTADTPFEWNSPAARELQEAVKQHLGPDAFFDMETVRSLVRELEPIPESMKLEQFQPPRRVPTFPFEIQPPPRKPVEEEIEEARAYFESQGFEFVNLVDGKTLVFNDEKGGITRVTVGPEGTVEYWPNRD